MPSADRAAPLRHSAFRLLLVGHATSALGSALVPVALAFAVLDVGGSAGALGLVLAAAQIPRVLFVPAGGVAGDRLPRRLVMLASDLARVVTQSGAAVLLLSGRATVAALVALQVVHGTAAAFFEPAATGLVPPTVPPEHVPQANAVLGLSRAGLAVVAQMIAGALVAAAGAGAAFAADAATYVVSAVALARLRPASTPPASAFPGLGRALADGWIEFRRHRWLWAGATHVALLNALALAPFFVLGPVVAERALGGAAAWGTIAAGFAAGGVAGGVVAVRVRPRRPLVAAFGAIALAVPELWLLAAAAPAPLVALGTFAGGAQATFWGAGWATTIQQQVPADAVSRVDAVGSFLTLLLAPVGFALVGPAADAVGAATVLWAAGAWVLVSTAVVLAVGGVREVERAVPAR